MPDEPTLRQREAASGSETGTPAPTGAGSPSRQPNADPEAGGGTDGNSEQARELKARLEREAKRNRDKDAHIGRLEAEMRDLRERFARPTPPEGGDEPLSRRFDSALQNLNSREMLAAIQEQIDQGVQERLKQVVPATLQAARMREEAHQGFSRLRDEFGVEDPPEDLGLDQALRSMSPEGAYIGKLVAEGRHEEAAQILSRHGERRKAEAARAKVLSLMSRADTDPAARQDLQKMLGATPSASARPGQSGYLEGEDPSLMYELSLAPHARKVDPEQWRNSEGF